MSVSMQAPTRVGKAEKECCACGVWYTPNKSNQKYCPDCGKYGGRKIKELNRNIKRSIERCGTGRPESVYINHCKYCGKEIVTYKGPKYICDKCNTEYHIANTRCANCQKPMLETNDQRDVYGLAWFCSDKCKEEWSWKIAKKNGQIGICPECGNEFILKNKKFCSVECFRNFRKAGKKLEAPSSAIVHFKCRICGNMGSCDEKEFKDPICSERCWKIFQNMQSTALNNSVQKTSSKKKKEQDHEKKNGLCGICRTPYKQCERMLSNFSIVPKGAVFEGNNIVSCPKFK